MFSLRLNTILFIGAFFYCTGAFAKDQRLYSWLDSSSHYYEKSDFTTSKQWAEKALKLGIKLKDQYGIMISYKELGTICYYEANYTDATKYYFSALSLAIKLKNKENESDCYQFIGNIYYAKNQYKKAAEYYHKAIQADPDKGLSKRKVNSLGYLAGIYYNLGNYDSSKIYYTKTIEAYEELNDSINIVLMKQNLAGVYTKLGQQNEALKILNETLIISLRSNNQDQIGYSYFCMGLFYAEFGEDKKAILELLKALEAYITIDNYAYMSNSCQALADSYYRLKDYKNALEYYKNYRVFLDSTQNTELTQELARKETRFEMEKVQLADSLKRNEIDREKQFRNDEKLKRQSVYTYAGLGGLVLMFFVAILLFRNNRIKQKANKSIEAQKIIVEEKQKELLDSIQYAKRIQTALLPQEKTIDKIMKKNKK